MQLHIQYALTHEIGKNRHLFGAIFEIYQHHIARRSMNILSEKCSEKTSIYLEIRSLVIMKIKEKLNFN